MALNHTLLGLLSFKPRTGYQLKQLFESSINHFWNAHMSQIYRELSSMEEKGWVTSIIEPQEGKPDKKIYSVTQEGTEVFKRWLQEFPETMEEAGRSEFLARIFFASHIDPADLAYELRRFIRKRQDQLNSYKETEARIKEQRKKGDPDAVFWYMTLRRGVKTTEASIEWAQECLDLVEEIKRNKE